MRVISGWFIIFVKGIRVVNYCHTTKLRKVLWLKPENIISIFLWVRNSRALCQVGPAHGLS